MTRDETPRAEPGPLDRAVSTLVADNGFWPVLVTCALVAGTVLASALLLAFRSRHPAVLACVVVLGMASIYGVEGDLRARRLGPGARAIGCLWLLSGLIALILDRTGLF